MSKWWIVLAAGLNSLAWAQTPNYQSDIETGRTSMTAAQQAQYKQDYDAAKAKWAAMTPEQKQATIAAARTKKLADLSTIELVGQRNDMLRETAAQSGQLKAEADAAKAKWDKLTAAEKQAYRKSAWQKRRVDLNAMEAVGQQDDAYVFPY